MNGSDLRHTGFIRGPRASIVRNGGTPQETEVGYASRRVDRGHYRYIVRASNHSRVYSGVLMSEGLAALAAYLSSEVQQ